MVVMQDATTYPLVKDDYPSSHSELQTQISEVFVANDSASLVNVHLVKGELPIDMEVNQEVKGESTTISSLPSHKVNNKVFQVLQSKEVNCIVINAISKSLLLEKLSLVPSHTISYVAALLHGFCSEHLSRELVEVMSGPKESGYASSLSNLVKMTTLSTFPFDPGKLTIAPFKNGQCNEIALLISIFFWNCWNVHCLLPCEHILCLLLLDNIDLHIPYIIRSLVYPKGEQSQGKHIRMLIISSNGTLCFGPIKYIKKIISAYESMFGEKPKLSSSPLEKNDHP